MHYWDHLGAEWAPLPCQADYANRLKEETIPEKKLLIGIIQRAFRDLIGHNPCETRSSKEHYDRAKTNHHISARKWFESEDAGPWTFRWVCRHLGVKEGALCLEHIQGLDIGRAILLLNRTESRICLEERKKPMPHGGYVFRAAPRIAVGE